MLNHSYLPKEGNFQLVNIFFSFKKSPNMFPIHKIFPFLLLLLGVGPNPKGIAQNHLGSEKVTFQRIGPENGLPSRYAHFISQDNKGFIWIGTRSGLSKYDGYQIKNFQHTRDSNMIPPVSYMFIDNFNRLWLGLDNKFTMCFDLVKEEFVEFRIKGHEEPTDILEESLICGYTDFEKSLWLSTDKTVYKWENQNGYLIPYELPSNSPNYSPIFSISEDSNKNIYLYNPWGGALKVFFKGKNDKDFTHYEIGEYENKNVDPLIAIWDSVDLLSVSNNYYWVASPNFLMNISNDGKEKLARLPIERNEISAFAEDFGKGLWLGSENSGIYYFDFKKKEFTNHRFKLEDPYSLSGNRISRSNPNYNSGVFVDQENNIWIGTPGDGLNRKINYFQTFQTYTYDPLNRKSLSSPKIFRLYKDSHDNIWITYTDDFSIDRFDVNQKEARNNIKYDELLDDWINPSAVVFEDKKGNFWIGLENQLILYDLNTAEKMYFELPLDVKFYNGQGSLVNDLFYHFIVSITEDKNGLLWISTSLGLYTFDLENQKFEHYMFFPNGAYKKDQKFEVRIEDQKDNLFFNEIFNLNHFENDLIEDENGYLYANPSGNGIISFSTRSSEYNHIKNVFNEKKSLSSNTVVTMFHSKGDIIWVGTNLGLDEIILGSNGTAREVKNHTVKGIITSIIEDSKGIIWAGTINGLIRFDPKNQTIRKYDKSDGLISSIFSDYAVKNTQTGELFFGTENGLLSFHPDSLGDNPYIPPIVFTSLTFFDSQDKSGKPKEIPNISYLEKVTLPYQQNTLIIEFASLSYNKTSKNQYAYKLGASEAWIQLGTERRLTFSDLSPGNYTLYVKGSNGDGIWNEEGISLKINILSPWWLSGTAKLLYIFLFLVGLYGMYRFFLSRQLAYSETHRLQELDAVKTKLYTNITHEFRTPLTVIIGMADKIRDNPQRWVDTGLLLIKRNGKNLLSLVNQMLDLSKLESGKLTVNLVQHDILPFLKYNLESYYSLAESKDIRLHFFTDFEQIVIDFDPEKIQHITENLLSNAIKYTPQGGTVIMEVEHSNQTLKLKIKDTGIGIPEDQLPHIFDRFYQIDDTHTRNQEGTGIGLALTKELVKLLGGNIEVTSKEGSGSTFKVSLPITHEAQKVETLKFEVLQPIKFEFGEKRLVGTNNGPLTLPMALIVEDNQDVVQYIMACLEGNFQLEVAHNGQEGIEIAQEIVPDIIISDVMMPQKDGYELCYTLKNDMRTSHIPIVLLTAKADPDSKIEGLRQGADAYLAKPFNEEELAVRLDKLLELRQILQQRYSSQAYLTQAPSETEGGSAPLEDEFIQKVRLVIDAHLDDHELNVSKLCKELGMSRSPLHNKLKALTGKSTTEFVRFIRLHKAKELLQSTDLNINEIAYDTGFRNHNYFTRMFGELFGMNPSEWRAKGKK